MKITDIEQYDADGDENVYIVTQKPNWFDKLLGLVETKIKYKVFSHSLDVLRQDGVFMDKSDEVVKELYKYLRKF